jgi:uncharacterized protein YyaL (SSP411 family)
MLSAFSRAYQLLKDEKYKEVIINNINFIKNKLYQDDKLLRTYNKGKAQYAGYLDDYAFLIKALFDSYEALFDASHLEWAMELLNYSNKTFWDDANYGYFYTSSEQEKLIYRMKDDHDQSIPSGNGIMLLNNLRFYSVTENSELLVKAEQILKKYSSHMQSNSYGYASYLLSLDFYLQKPKEILIVNPGNELTPEIHHAIFNTFLPNKVVILLTGEELSPVFSASLVQGKESINGKATAYVCHNFTCSQPVFSAKDLLELLH